MNSTPKERPAALCPPHLGGGVDGAGVGAVVPLRDESRPDYVEGVRGEGGRDPRRRANAEVRRRSAESFLSRAGREFVQSLV